MGYSRLTLLRFTSVCCLFFVRCPSAIFWFVISIIIYTINSAAFWSRPHISVEIFKYFPSFTYGNSSSAIVCIFPLLWIFASGAHAAPNVVLSFMTHSMSREYSGVSLSLEAPATLRGTRFNMCFSRDDFRSAVALEFPFAPLSRDLINGYKPTEALAGKRLFYPPASTASVISVSQCSASDRSCSATIASAYPICTAMTAAELIYTQGGQISEFLSGEFNANRFHSFHCTKINSLWAKQTPVRAKRQMQMLASGQWVNK